MLLKSLPLIYKEQFGIEYSKYICNSRLLVDGHMYAIEVNNYNNYETFKGEIFMIFCSIMNNVLRVTIY